MSETLNTVLSWLAPLRTQREPPLVVGVSGAQGSGKSTLCRHVAGALTEQGATVVVISIDDLYKTRAERQLLAQEVHPLCAHRGLFGTHDVALGHRLLDQLCDADASAITRIPRFDKSIDDRSAVESEFVGRPDLVLFEGWCVGARPGPEWRRPINAREARDDPDGRWVRWTEAQLAEQYLPLWERLHALLFIEVPSFEHVVHGRWRQEQALGVSAGEDAPGVMSRAEVEDYVAVFERKTRELLTDLPVRADLVVPAWQPPR